VDFQHRPGGKTGAGALALETVDICKDPHFKRNHLGSYECKLCRTLHNNEGSYLAHTQGKKQQTSLARRGGPAQPAPGKVQVEVKTFVKIGRPGYKVAKQRDSEMGRQSLLFQIDHPEIAEGIMPRLRARWQCLLMAAEPCETTAFKVPSREIDKAEGKFWTHWNQETKQFFLQFHFKMEQPLAPPSLPAGPPGVHPPAPGILPPRLLLPESLPSPLPGGLRLPPMPPTGPAPSGPPGPPHLSPPAPGIHPPAPVVHSPTSGVHPPAPGVHPQLLAVHPPAPVVHSPTSGVHPPATGVHPPAPGVHPPAPGVHPPAPWMHPQAPGVLPQPPGVHPSVPGVHPQPPGVHPSNPGVHPPTPMPPMLRSSQHAMRKPGPRGRAHCLWRGTEAPSQTPKHIPHSSVQLVMWLLCGGDRSIPH
uniref:U1-type domain-containing protein n=1 Tax=Cebus imitator TaxID=2715852 RepID=A0A2K5SA78_CEBIM